MSDRLRIDLPGADEPRLPGSTVSGTVEWALDRAPEALELRLFWYTEGRGDRDAGVARSLRIASPGAAGSQPFALDLPSGPYSFSGRLVSLVWALELVVSPGDAVARCEIVVSPSNGEVLIDRVAG